MGKDLYYIQTPKEVDQQYHDLEYYTWHFLTDLWKLEDEMDLDGKILDKHHIPQLETILETAKYSNNEKLIDDIEGLINAINKMESITLVIRD